MSYRLFESVSFGSSQAGLATVGYRLYDSAGAAVGARVSSSIQELGGGQYGALVTFPAGFRGRITWDTGGLSPVYASASVNPEEAEDDATEVAELEGLKDDIAGLRNALVAGLGSGQVTQASVMAYDGVLRPPVTRYEGRPVLGRAQAVVLSQAQTPVVEWTVRNPLSGDPLDLSSVLRGPYGSSSSSSPGSASTPTVLARGLEALYTAGSAAVDMIGHVHDAALGQVRFTFDGRLSANPGVYLVEVGVLHPDTRQLLVSNRFHALVERGLFGLSLSACGPPSWQEIKIALRDSAPEDGYLNDTMEWDLAEVLDCVVSPVRWWNELPPPVARRTTTTFEFQDNWRTGILSRLYAMAAASYRREAVQYQASGTALNDKAKAPDYERKAQELEALFRRWAKVKKVQINTQGGFGRAGLYVSGR